MAESGIVLGIIQNAKDSIHSSIKVIPIEHAEIHSGKFYAASRSTSDLGASSWLDLELITPSSSVSYSHLYWDFNVSGGLGEIVFCDLSTATTYAHGASTMAAINKNRVSTNTAGLSIFYGSTTSGFITSTMTSSQAVLLANYYEGSTGTNAGRAGAGGDMQVHEYILASNSTYVLRLWNRGTAGAASLRLFWYED